MHGVVRVGSQPLEQQTIKQIEAIRGGDSSFATQRERRRFRFAATAPLPDRNRWNRAHPVPGSARY